MLRMDFRLRGNDGGVCVLRRHDGESSYRRLLHALERARFFERHALEAHSITRPQLSHLPQLRTHDRRGTDESAKARPVRTENHRHVSREVDRADCVRVVVDVRRMQSSLAAIGSCPSRLRTNEPHACAARVVMHFPARGEERLDILGREEVGRTMRPIHDAQFPFALVFGNELDRNCKVRFIERLGIVDVQHVSSTQRAPRVPAELAQRERRTTVHVARHVEAASHSEIRSLASAVDALQLQHAAR